MAGVKEIEKTIDGFGSLVDAARRAGPDGWTWDGTVLRVNNKALADAAQQLLQGIMQSQVELEKEAGDLSPLEVIRLYHRAQNILPKILGH